MNGWWHQIMRRLVQAGIIVLFAGAARAWWDLQLLTGDLSGSTLLGSVPLADPFAALQILATGQMLGATALLGAAIVFAFYAVIGGRTFCSWVCPVNPITDLAGWVRRRLRITTPLRMKRSARYWALGLTIVLSALTGVAAFEWMSPIGLLQRWLIFGTGVGGLVALALFLFDVFVARHGWCGHLCPLGAFWSVVGSVAQVRVAFDAQTCTRCGECAVVCPEPQVLDLDLAGQLGRVSSGACTNCGRCIPACPEGSLSFGLRPLISSTSSTTVET